MTTFPNKQLSVQNVRGVKIEKSALKGMRDIMHVQTKKGFDVTYKRSEALSAPISMNENCTRAYS